MLDSGLRFCVLYTDLSNQTSNAIYQRIGYQVVQEVSDFDIVPRASS
jgi:predicted GNAT family acetyltransferase